ncbi:MAG: AbiEi antitoxin N-terminal domain-containing protein, partial [Mediterranea sp.]|nr:AbiEi antitoxin N-terminal domain-containing protein [Mediterranea sp.]
MDAIEEIKKGKINKLMQEVPKGLVLLSMWLRSEGYSYELQQRYRNSGWLKSIGTGAMLRGSDELTLSGTLAALQQTGMNVHVG